MFTMFNYDARRPDDAPFGADRRIAPVAAFLLLAVLVAPTAGCINPGIANSADGPHSTASPFVRQTGQPPTQWVVIPMPKPSVVPFGISAGPGKDIWVTENVGNHVDRIDPATERFKRYPVPTQKAVLGAIALGPDGNMWFAERAVSKMGRITPTGVVTEFPLPGGSDPLGIVTGSDGNLWFSDFSHKSVAKMTTAGVVTEYALPSGSSPQSLTLGPDHDVWFDEDGPRVGKVTPAGSVTEYSTGNSSPTSGIAAGDDGALWFGEVNLPRLGRVTTNGVVTSFYIHGASSPEGVLSVGASNVLYIFVDQGLATYNIRTHGFEILGYPPENSPIGPFTLGADGNVWFTQEDTNDVGVYVIRILSVSPTSLDLSKGQLATLTASEIENKAPLQAVTSNSAIATVVPAGSNTFTVTGVATGSCTITVMDDRKNTFAVPVTVH